MSDAMCTTNCPSIESMMLGVKMVGWGRSSDSVSSGAEREMKRNAPATTSPCIVAWESPNLTPIPGRQAGRQAGRASEQCFQLVVVLRWNTDIALSEADVMHDNDRRRPPSEESLRDL